VVTRTRNVWTYTSGVYPETQFYRSQTWNRTPNFRNLARFQLPVNPYNDLQGRGVANNPIARRTEQFSPFTVYDQRIYLDEPFVGFPVIADDAAPSRSSLENDALTRALVDVANIKANIGVTLKEAAKTSDLILDRARRIHDAFFAFRRGQFKKTARLLGLTPNTVHRTWLEYKYGWTPLMYEAKGAAEFFAQQQDAERRLSFVVSKASAGDGSHFSQTAGLPFFPEAAVLGGMTYALNASRRVRVKLWCRYENPHAAAAQQVGITNPLLFAWEILPFSFVFDWFVGVGDYLAAQTALTGVVVEKAMVSEELSWKGTVVQVFPGYSGYYYLYDPWEFTREHEGREYRRAAFVPDPLSLAPTTNNRLSWQRLASGLALLRGSFPRNLRGVRV
jgi:hypothetical protein